MSADDLPATVAVVGPTAAGKAGLGLQIAERFELPILVCDSVKVYRRLDIGSAKPSAEARARVRHELLDLVDPDASFSAGDYARHAIEHLRRGPGLLVGGTGFYLRATAQTQSALGAPDADVAPDDPGRSDFEASWRGREADEAGAIWRALCRVDPETADTIHPNNVVRALRALWMCQQLGGAVSEARRNDPPRRRFPLMVVVVDPGPDALRAAIEARTDVMLAAGWLGEVGKLRDDGYDGRHKAMRSVGYRQLLEVIEGRMSLEAAKGAIVGATWDVSRRQRTYFRHQLDADVVAHIEHPSQCPWDRIQSFLQKGVT